MEALTDNLLLKVVSEIHDPVTTTDELIPSGETSSYRSNPLGLAEFTLSRKDPEYVKNAKDVHKAEQIRVSGKCPCEHSDEFGKVWNGLKEAFSRENLLKNLNFSALLNLGLVLTAVGIVYFKNPNHFAFGGTSGLSILLADLFPHINVGGFMWIINLVLVVLGFVFLGVKCMGWTIYSSFALSFFVSVCEWLYPSGVSMSGDAMLDLVFAVFLPALGAAIVFDIGASTGGTDIVALILAKYTSMEIGKALMASDILIVLAAAWRFGMGTGLYCILGLIGKSFVVDGAIENIRLRKVCTIMTANPQPILDFIIKEMNRSATVEKAYGAYTHHELSVLVTVLTRRQALQLRNFLRENDPHSFITIVNSSEIIGKGFRSFN